MDQSGRPAHQAVKSGKVVKSDHPFAEEHIAPIANLTAADMQGDEIKDVASRKRVKKCVHGSNCVSNSCHIHTSQALKGYARRNKEKSEKKEEEKKEDKKKKVKRFYKCKLGRDECPIFGDHYHFGVGHVDASDLSVEVPEDWSGDVADLSGDFKTAYAAHDAIIHSEYELKAEPPPTVEMFGPIAPTPTPPLSPPLTPSPSLPHLPLLDLLDGSIPSGESEPVPPSATPDPSSPPAVPVIATEKELLLPATPDDMCPITNEAIHELFLFTNPNANTVGRSSRSVTQWLKDTAAKTPFAKQDRIYTINDPAKLSYHESRKMTKNDRNRFIWFWEGWFPGRFNAEEEKDREHSVRMELVLFAKCFSHFEAGYVYRDVARAVLADPVFTKRETSLVKEGVLSPMTFVTVDTLLASLPNHTTLIKDPELFANTKNHVLNQLLIRGLRSTSFASLGSAPSAMHFQNGGRTRIFSPHAPRSASRASTARSTPSTVTMRGSTS
jgi:hypothetical protein